MPNHHMHNLHIEHHVYSKRFERSRSALLRAEKYPSTGDAKALRASLHRVADELNAVRAKLNLPKVKAVITESDGDDAHWRRIWFRTCQVDTL
jgi:hypothetical protein